MVRRNERHVFHDPATGFERALLSPVMAGSAVEVVHHRLPPQAATGTLPPYPPGTEKHVIVAAGTLVVTVSDDTLQLREGDAL